MTAKCYADRLGRHNTPGVETRANLAPGPETRPYRARYFLNDAPIGNWSDVLTVTVPG